MTNPLSVDLFNLVKLRCVILTALSFTLDFNSVLHLTRLGLHKTFVWIRLSVVSTNRSDVTWTLVSGWTLALRSTRAIFCYRTLAVIFLTIRERAGAWGKDIGKIVV